MLYSMNDSGELSKKKMHHEMRDVEKIEIVTVEDWRVGFGMNT